MNSVSNLAKFGALLGLSVVLLATWPAGASGHDVATDCGKWVPVVLEPEFRPLADLVPPGVAKPPERRHNCDDATYSFRGAVIARDDGAVNPFVVTTAASKVGVGYHVFTVPNWEAGTDYYPATASRFTSGPGASMAVAAQFRIDSDGHAYYAPSDTVTAFSIVGRFYYEPPSDSVPTDLQVKATPNRGDVFRLKVHCRNYPGWEWCP